MNVLLDKVVHLSSERAERLTSLALERRMSEDALLEKALDLLFEVEANGDVRSDQAFWLSVSEESLRQIWDNEADAVYDDWKGLYGLQER